jgi:hypothetical protein
MQIFITLFLAWAPMAHAKVNPICLHAVTGGWNPAEASAPEVQNVLTWIDVKLAQTAEYPLGISKLPEFNLFVKKRGLDWKNVDPAAKPDWVARFYFEQWRKWDDVRRAQRDAYLKLELDQLGPVSRQRPDVLAYGGGYARLKELSAKNSARMLAELRERHPAYAQARPEDAAKAENFSKLIRFNYLEPVKSRLSGDAPLVSPNALTKLDLGLLNPFYSSLVSGSNMVGFELLATAEGHLPLVLNGENPREAFRLNDAFARANGMMLPRLRDPTELYDFIAAKDPATARKFFEKNRDLVPATVTTPEEFRIHLEHAVMDYIFPQDKQFDRLFLLRSRLIDFVMTAEDGEAFLREAFRIYLSNLSVERPVAYLMNVQELSTPAGFQNIFAWEFLQFVGWERGVALQIPVSVPAAEAPKIRVETWP